MSLTIAIASGKGGAGKTTLATNLAAVAPPGTALLDCDVEEPNAHLFLRPEQVERRLCTVPVPQFDAERCDSCGLCGRACRFNALLVLPGSPPTLHEEMCHSCGACVRACPREAIREVPRPIGEVRTGQRNGLLFADGVLDVGRVRSEPLVADVRGQHAAAAVRLVDAPPGTSCPVVAAVRGADYVVLVAEPTPFGLSDLRMAVEMVRHLRLRFGVLINRAGLGDDGVLRFCRADGLNLLGELPFDRRVAEACAAGRLAAEDLPSYRRRCAALLSVILREARKCR